jgi:hypothetical protein
MGGVSSTKHGNFRLTCSTKPVDAYGVFLLVDLFEQARFQEEPLLAV